ncbi:sugar transferase [Brevundimonas sp. KM4]|uniref:sugar transferase n=1 Tax=Brevundimonas sp. KM4 TaxID=1628191 RepID=UPI0005F7D65F|nr:sugar transferase [Brevundimonas sp. KM4]KJV43378.1 sugar transferase [Brevundimonas sp. KM4]
MSQDTSPPASRSRHGYDRLKRCIDVVGSLAGLVALSPVLLVVAILVRARLGSPVLFRQIRPGLHERSFEMVKFRTMRDTTGPDGHPLPDAERLTPFGRWLRSTSLDELPELWNVLKGEMSLVGPRPLLMAYLPLYSPEEARRHEVRPGVTGWAQVKGRNALTWGEKFACDIWYVDNMALIVDLKIMLITVYKVLLRSSVSSPTSETMERFTGTAPPVDASRSDLPGF